MRAVARSAGNHTDKDQVGVIDTVPGTTNCLALHTINVNSSDNCFSTLNLTFLKDFRRRFILESNFQGGCSFCRIPMLSITLTSRGNTARISFEKGLVKDRVHLALNIKNILAG